MDTETQATRWLVRLDATRSPELIAEHAKWMAESARHLGHRRRLCGFGSLTPPRCWKHSRYLVGSVVLTALTVNPQHPAEGS